jgi:hypothetical protein
MTRYTARPASLGRSNSEPMIPHLTVTERGSVRTGLLDHHGRELWRKPEPCGFGREGE